MTRRLVRGVRCRDGEVIRCNRPRPLLEEALCRIRLRHSQRAAELQTNGSGNERSGGPVCCCTEGGAGPAAPTTAAGQTGGG